MERRRPSRVLVWAEYGIGEELTDPDGEVLGVSLPVWDRSPRGIGVFTAAELGLSDGLAERLVRWNAIGTARLPEEQRYQPAAETKGWAETGLRLAWQLQQELPDVEVHVHDRRGNEVPVGDVWEG